MTEAASDVFARLAARIEQAQADSEIAQADVAAAAKEARWSDLCPDDRGRCIGETANGWPCPREAAATCPFAQQRSATASRDYLRACGFGVAYQDPDPAKLLGRHVATSPQIERVAADLAAYWANLGANVAANQGMMLLGPAGTGKTYTLALTALAARGTGLDVRCVFAPTLFDLIHEKSGMVDVYEDCDLLLLDDFGVQYTADWVLSRFQSFVERRWSAQRPVCVTSNLTADRLKELAGYERFVSRVRQWCGERIWATGKTDLRAVA